MFIFLIFLPSLFRFCSVPKPLLLFIWFIDIEIYLFIIFTSICFYFFFLFPYHLISNGMQCSSVSHERFHVTDRLIQYWCNLVPCKNPMRENFVADMNSYLMTLLNVTVYGKRHCVSWFKTFFGHPLSFPFHFTPPPSFFFFIFLFCLFCHINFLRFFVFLFCFSFFHSRWSCLHFWGVGFYGYSVLNRMKYWFSVSHFISRSFCGNWLNCS